jgi:hypothetical protein
VGGIAFLLYQAQPGGLGPWDGVRCQATLVGDLDGVVSEQPAQAFQKGVRRLDPPGVATGESAPDAWAPIVDQDP